ncbi:S8 family serine peptidase [Massilia sp. KIM]|uniref:S8 family serine peptidase n=1 Tax=Massilia sp. KIM TaxID=1955422 RepID=UPI00098EA8F2|nr:S8 family serine peptidase [Massilia sp. KIM]
MPKSSHPPGEPQGRHGKAPDGASESHDGAMAQPATDAASPREHGHAVAERKKKYLVAPRAPLSAAPAGGAPGAAAGGLAPFASLGGLGNANAYAPPMSLSALEQALQAAPDIDVVEALKLRAGLAMASVGGALGAAAGDADGVVVARMTDQRARELYQSGQGRLLVERDQHLHLLDPVLRRPDLVSSLTPYDGPQTELVLVVLGKDGAPLAEAEVSLFGGVLPSSGLTGPDGMVRLRLYGEDAHAVSGLYVKPRTDYWSFYQRDPDLSLDEPNLVALRALADWPALQGIPQQNAMGWGARAMRLDQVPPQFRGQGVKVAVIDSGAATSHGNLNRIRAGFDVINKTVDRNTWNIDTLGHGSHCAGVIGAANPAWGIRGFAPDAEIHVCKLFPGGQVSQLIDALEYCIEQQIDVVNLSLGGGSPSEALERQIARARQAGVACIAAAGNSGGPVQYPASSPLVLAVAAIGKLGEFPPDSYHAETLAGDVDAQGYFTARFSCGGPQVDVAAPGVAVVSAVPPNNFAAWDGTSMAAPHVSGLAALVLAHRAEFQGLGGVRSAERVERLFQVLRMSARPVTLSDPTRVGYGMPDALVALGLPVTQQAPWAAQPIAFGLPHGMFAGVADKGMAQYLAGVGGQAAQTASGFPYPYAFGGLRPSGW